MRDGGRRTGARRGRGGIGRRRRGQTVRARPPRGGASSRLTPTAPRAYAAMTMRMRTSLTPVRASLLASVLFLLAIPACSSSAAGPSDGKLSVVTAFYPLQEAAERVGDDHVDVTNLTAPGVEPHDLELTPHAVQAISEADVVLYLGDGFQPAVEDAVEGRPGHHRRPPGEPGHGASAGGVGSRARRRSTRLARSDAATRRSWGRSQTRSRTSIRRTPTSTAPTRPRFPKELSTLDAEYRTGLERLRADLIVTNHAAFGYLAAAYGLRQESISGLARRGRTQRRPARQLRDLVQREGITTIFTEELVSPKVAETLASEAGVTRPRSFTPSKDSRPTRVGGRGLRFAMRENLQTLAERAWLRLRPSSRPRRGR